MFASFAESIVGVFSLGHDCGLLFASMQKKKHKEIIDAIKNYR